MFDAPYFKTYLPIYTHTEYIHILNMFVEHLNSMSIKFLMLVPDEKENGK